VASKVENHVEILVAQAVAPGYDPQSQPVFPPQSSPGPLVSESELRALLGPSE